MYKKIHCNIKKFLEEISFWEQSKEYPHADQMLENLLLDHESIIRQRRKD